MEGSDEGVEGDETHDPARKLKREREMGHAKDNGRGLTVQETVSNGQLTVEGDKGLHNNNSKQERASRPLAVPSATQAPCAKPTALVRAQQSKGDFFSWVAYVSYDETERVVKYVDNKPIGKANKRAKHLFAPTVMLAVCGGMVCGEGNDASGIVI